MLELVKECTTAALYENGSIVCECLTASEKPFHPVFGGGRQASAENWVEHILLIPIPARNAFAMRSFPYIYDRWRCTLISKRNKESVPIVYEVCREKQDRNDSEVASKIIVFRTFLDPRKISHMQEGHQYFVSGNSARSLQDDAIEQ